MNEETMTVLGKEAKDPTLFSAVTCPVCGEAFRKSGSSSCPHCYARVFDTNAEGNVVLLDPALLDSAKAYPVHGLNRFLPLEKTFEDDRIPAGEIVRVRRPFVTDVTVSVAMNGEGLAPAKTDENGAEYCFVMPEREVFLDVSIRNDMERRVKLTQDPAEPKPAMAAMMGMMGGASMADFMNRVPPTMPRENEKPPMKCPTCGTMIPGRFCPGCGNPRPSDG